MHTTHSLKSRITQLEREKVRLIDERKIALEKYEQCVNVKEEVCKPWGGTYQQGIVTTLQVEVELYSKFKAVLNEKKDKIRQLIEELESQQPQSAGEGEDEGHVDNTKVEVESAAVHTQKPASSGQTHNFRPLACSSLIPTVFITGLLGEPQEVVSPPVKRRKREPRQRAAQGPDIPCPPSLSRRPLPNDQVKAHSEVPHSSSAEGDDLLQLL